MSSIASIRSSNNAALSALQRPTAVFVGGTSGIGQAMAESLATHTSGRANVVLVGRNEAAANKILAGFPSSVDPGTREFVKCDVTSMKEIGEVAEKIRSKYPQLDFLVMSPGWAALEGRNETDEGIDRKMAVNYYGRWKFIHDLLPSFASAGTKVLSVLGAGAGSSIDLEDLAMKKSYSVAKVAVVTPTYNDLMMESFASLHPKHSFIQSSPGVVRTNYLHTSTTGIIRWTAPIIMGLSYPFSNSAEDCAEYMWHGVLSSGKGAHRVGAKGQDIGKSRYYGDDEQRKALWEHTVSSVCVSGEL